MPTEILQLDYVPKSRDFAVTRLIFEFTIPAMVEPKKSPLRFLVVSLLVFSAFILLAAGTSSAQAEPSAGPGQTTTTNEATPPLEVYGTASDGTVLHWIVYTPSTPGPWPAVLVIHGGGFTSGTPGQPITGEDLAAAGYIAFSIEYRLAPPGALPGQISDGRFPDQSDDVKLAVRTARADPRCNGQVGAVGGSAGGYQAAFCAATGTIGDDRLDVGVSLSGAYDLSDFSPNPSLDSYTANVTNYVNVPSTDTAALRAASPAWLADSATAPLFMANSLEDPMPYSQLARHDHASRRLGVD